MKHIPAGLGQRHFWRGRLAVLALCLAGAAAGSAFAQTTTVVDLYTTNSVPVAATVNSIRLQSYTDDRARLTIPVNSTGTNGTVLTVVLAPAQATLISSQTNFVDPDTFITNNYDLSPVYATLAVTGVPATGGGAAVVLGLQSVTNTSPANANFNVSVTLNYTNVASGDYDMAVMASGANSWRYSIPVKAGFTWSAGAGANTNFTAAANWVGGVVPGPGDIVIMDNAGAVSANSVPTVAIATDTTIGSVSDIHTGDNYTHWSIADGATLSILGDGGFRQLVDWIDDNERSRIRGSGAGTLVISNANAEFKMITTRQNNSHDSADFSALNTMIVDVKRIAFNDFPSYPNVGTNGIMNRPQRFVYDMDWALTNILRATHTDLNGWTNDASEYGMVINRQVINLATGNDGGMHFGLWNELYFDSILFGGPSQMENPEVDFRATSGSYLLLRNTDKVSRVSNLTIADNRDYFSTGSAGGTGNKVDVSFTRGTVDALVDTLILGRDPRVTANGAAFGKLFLGAGTFDVNTAILGYQTGPGLGTESGAAQGRVELSLGGTFRVNNSLVLGYMVTNNLQTVATFGQLAVSGAGSTAAINHITVGGPTNDVSQENTISITGGGTLIVSNSVASPDVRLNSLTMNDSTIVLFPDAGTNAPCVFVNNLTIGGTGNTLRLGALTGVGAYPATIPLISYLNTPAPNYTLELPAGLYGYVVNNTVNGTIDAVISTTPPANLVWNGNVDGNWDLTTPNWQGSLLFANGDAVTFDDSASGTTSVLLGGEVTPGSGGVLFSNTSKIYTLSGGTISGTAGMTKQGTNLLTIDSMSSLPLLISEGIVTGSGTLGATTVEAGAELDFAGTINKLTTSGVSRNTGTVNIGLSVPAGTLDNDGAVNGTFSVGASGTVLNRPGRIIAATGTSTVGAGGLFVHEGQFNNTTARLGIAGLLTGSGTVSDLTGDANGNNGRLEINAGGIFTPGGSNQIGTFKVEGRFDLNAGTPNGTMIIDVDMNDPQKNDVLFVDKWSNLRGALVMNNIGSIPFALGQSFVIASNNFSLPNTPETAFDLANKITPKVPGIGLQWDLSNLRTNGVIAIMAAPTTPPALTNLVVGGTNLNLTWPTSHLGWQLKVQTNSLDVGLTTDWHPVAGTELTNQYEAPIDAANPAVFYLLSNQ